MDILIVVSILIYDPTIMLMLSILVVPVFIIFYGAVKNKIAALSEEAYEIQADTGKNLYQSIFGYVDIMINNNIEARIGSQPPSKNFRRLEEKNITSKIKRKTKIGMKINLFHLLIAINK